MRLVACSPPVYSAPWSPLIIFGIRPNCVFIIAYHRTLAQLVDGVAEINICTVIVNLTQSTITHLATFLQVFLLYNCPIICLRKNQNSFNSPNVLFLSWSHILLSSRVPLTSFATDTAYKTCYNRRWRSWNNDNRKLIHSLQARKHRCALVRECLLILETIFASLSQSHPSRTPQSYTFSPSTRFFLTISSRAFGSRCPKRRCHTTINFVIITYTVGQSWQLLLLVDHQPEFVKKILQWYWIASYTQRLYGHVWAWRVDVGVMQNVVDLIDQLIWSPEQFAELRTPGRGMIELQVTPNGFIDMYGLDGLMSVCYRT